MLRLSRLAPGVATLNARQKSTSQKRAGSTIPSFQRALDDESGQVLAWAVFVIILFLGIAGFSVDIGYGVLVKKELQTSADAAALAAAQHLADGTWHDVAINYSASHGSNNAYSSFTLNTPSITARCSTTVEGPPWNIPCTSTNPNVVTVQQTATFHTFFAWVLGHPTLTVSVVSAASKGAKPQPYNIAIVLDTTYSMNTRDSNCGNKTQLQCAEDAISVILGGLAPTEDNVSLFTFPAMDAATADNDTSCSSRQTPTGEPYTFPSTTATSMSTMPFTTSSGHSTTTVQTTYQITGFGNDYRSSDTAKSLSSSSTLTQAIGGVSRCTGIKVNDSQNTYFAATIYAAQSALLAEQAANPGTLNAMIILSDGNATAVNNSYFQDMATSTQSTPGVSNTSSGIYPNLQGECGQGVDAASAASTAGTLVFTIAYGAPSTSKSGGTYGNGGNCASDRGAGQHPNITPCQTMQQMSTGWNKTPQDTSHFYSDYYAPGGDSGCQAAGANNTTTSLNNIASSIVGALSGVRLIPPNTP
jgi:Flp pilus assembly protein TadG